MKRSEEALHKEKGKSNEAPRSRPFRALLSAWRVLFEMLYMLFYLALHAVGRVVQHERLVPGAPRRSVPPRAPAALRAPAASMSVAGDALAALTAAYLAARTEAVFRVV